MLITFHLYIFRFKNSFFDIGIFLNEITAGGRFNASCNTKISFYNDIER